MATMEEVKAGFRTQADWHTGQVRALELKIERTRIRREKKVLQLRAIDGELDRINVLLATARKRAAIAVEKAESIARVTTPMEMVAWSSGERLPLPMPAPGSADPEDLDLADIL